MFVTQARWARRAWTVKRLDLYDGAPDALLDAWGVPLRRRLLCSVQSHRPIDKGHRFDLGGGVLLEWTVEEANGLAPFEETPGELAHLPQAQLSRLILDTSLAPMAPVVEFVHELLVPAGTEFIYQPPLMPEEIARGDVRATAIVGGYAVRDATGAKLAQIPRPFAVDRDGLNRVWGEITVTGRDRDWLLIVRFQKAHLLRLARPIVVYGLDTFGYYNGGTPGASTSNHGDDYLFAAGGFTAPANVGNATDVGAYLKSRTGSAGQCTLGYYNDSRRDPSGLEADGDGETQSTVASWHEDGLDAPTALTPGNVYHPTVNCTENHTLYYDAGSCDLGYTASAYVHGRLANPWPGAITRVSNVDYSFYIKHAPRERPSSRTRTFTGHTEAAKPTGPFLSRVP